MKIKKLILFSLVSFSILFPSMANAEVVSESGETYGLESVDKKINEKMKNLENSPTFNIAIVKESNELNKDMTELFKNKEYPDNSILLGYSEKDKQAVIIVGDVLNNENIVSPNLLKQMYSEYGLTKLKVGEVFNGLEELSDSIYYQLSLSSIGNNSYDYKSEKDAIEKETINKEKEKESKETSSKMIIYVGSVLVILSIIIIFLSNKNSFVSKMVFKNKKNRKILELVELSDSLLKDSEFKKDNDLNYLANQYYEFNLASEYQSLVEKENNKYLNGVKSILEQKDLGDLETLNLNYLLISILDKNKEKRNKLKYTILLANLHKKFPEVPESILKTVEFENMLNRFDFSKQKVISYLKEKSDEFYKILDSRYLIFDDTLESILSNIKFNLTEEESSDLKKTREFVLNDYHKDITLNDLEFSKKCENIIYHKLSKIRLSKLNEPENIKELLLSKISDYDLAVATDKVLERQISKIKILM